MERYLLQKDGCTPKQKAQIKTKKAVKTRKYKAVYLDYGFTSVSVDGQVRPQCVICEKTLCNNSMWATKLKHHLHTQHQSLVGKNRAFFEQRLQQMKKQKSTLQNREVNKSVKAVKASYQMALLVAKNKLPYEQWEDLIITAATEMCRTMVGESEAEEFKSMSMSFAGRICDLSSNIEYQLIQRLKRSRFALQLDHTADLDNGYYLVAYVRYCHEMTILEDFLFCTWIENDTNADTLFNILNHFLSSHELTWEACVGICTDAGSSLPGLDGMQAKVFRVAPHVSWTCCMIHRETLMNKTLALEQEMKEALQSAIHEISSMKRDSEKECFLSTLSQGIGEEHLDLFFKTDSNWLSRGQVLQQLYKHKITIRQYILNSKNKAYLIMLDEPCWLVQLAYLADIFDKLNSLSISMQATDTTVHLYRKIAAFKSELDTWKTSLEAGSSVSFPLLTEAVEETEYGLWSVEWAIKNHLMSIKASLDKYFPEHIYFYENSAPQRFPVRNTQLNDWVLNPFQSEGLATAHLPPNLQEQLIKLQGDLLFEICFEKQSLEEFWLNASPEYPALSKCAVDALLPFASTSLSEIGFSTLVGLRSMYKYGSDIEELLRICISPIQPQIDILTSEELDYVSD